MCMWEWATFGSQPWLTWCISCSVLHAVMMMPRPSLVLGLLTTFLLFFLPDPGQPWAAKHFIITINYLIPWWIQSPGPSLINSLPGSPTDHCDWLLWIVLKTLLDLAAPMMHSWTFDCQILDFFFLNTFYLISLLLWNKHAGYVLYTHLLWSGGLSDCNTCPFCAFMLWDHCGSGRRLFLFAFVCAFK